MKQENVNDKKLLSLTESENMELTECPVVYSNEKITEDHMCYIKDTAEKLDDEKEYLSIKDAEIDNGLSKIKIDLSKEIYTSEASKDRKCVVVDINFTQIKERLMNYRTQRSEKQKIKTRFFAIIDPNKNQEAENELSREISKDMFSRVSKKKIFYIYLYVYLT